MTNGNNKEIWEDAPVILKLNNHYHHLSNETNKYKILFLKGRFR